LREVAEAHRLLLFGSILSNNKRHIERLRRSRLHPRPEERGFTRDLINSQISASIKRRYNIKC
jgi:hypothetical protein